MQTESGSCRARHTKNSQNIFFVHWFSKVFVYHSLEKESKGRNVKMKGQERVGKEEEVTADEEKEEREREGQMRRKERGREREGGREVGVKMKEGKEGRKQGNYWH